MESLSFDPLVQLYDDTRTVDAACLQHAMELIVARFPPAKYPRVLEPGIGTGRIAVPFVENGYRVVGIDISEKMLGGLRQRIAGDDASDIVCCQADAITMPFQSEAFDLAVAVHLFYFIPQWQLAVDELLRVVKGPVILMHTGYGREVPWLNEQYKAACAQYGYHAEHIGARSTSDVVQYAQTNCCQVEEIRDRWKWTEHIQLSQALSHLNSRAYSFTTVAPDEIHEEIMRGLTAGVHETFGGDQAVVEVENKITLVLLLRERLMG